MQVIMNDELLYQKSLHYLDFLCRVIGERSVGSEGNHKATAFAAREFSKPGWTVRMDEFDAMDWEENGAALRSGDYSFDVRVSPYSNGFRGEGVIVEASTPEELEKLDARDRIIFLHGDITREQLMPKNFIFYNPKEHQRIVKALENSGAKAIVCATGHNPTLAGGVYPFPLIEDGDFDIPSVYMTEEEGVKLLPFAGKMGFLESNSRRIPSRGFNVSALSGSTDKKKIVVTAHIDTKKGTPGAIDNATGVIVLLLLAELLNGFTSEDLLVELVALNGEDYYAVPGQMKYIAANQDHFDKIILNINIDGAGLKDSLSAYSVYNLPDQLAGYAAEIFGKFPGITKGTPWPQGDHSIFVQYGVPAIAFSSDWFITNMDIQDITHSPKDQPGIVDCRKIAEISKAIDAFIRSFF
jgi:aminopeptidase YwaD